VEQRLDVRPFAGGDDDSIDLGAGDDRRVIARVKLRAGFLREIARTRRLGIGNGEKPDGGMLRRQPRAQRADATRADDGDSQFLALDGRVLRAPFYQALARGEPRPSAARSGLAGSFTAKRTIVRSRATPSREETRQERTQDARPVISCRRSFSGNFAS
jgi:hypothetical protein